MSDDQLRDRLNEIIDSTLRPLLDQRDGPARLLERLPIIYPPDAVGPDYNTAQEAWDLTGLFYAARGRYFERCRSIQRCTIRCFARKRVVGSTRVRH